MGNNILVTPPSSICKFVGEGVGYYMATGDINVLGNSSITTDLASDQLPDLFTTIPTLCRNLSNFTEAKYNSQAILLGGIPLKL